MAVIKLVCKQCNGQMELDDSRDVAFCTFCGTKHVIKDEIVNITQNIYHGASGEDITKLLTDAKTLVDLEQFEKAFIKYKKAVDTDPANPGAWLGYAITTRKGDQHKAFESAYRLASGGQKNTVFSSWLSAAASSPDLKAAYCTVDAVHKGMVIEKWITYPVSIDECEAWYKNAEGVHKDIVLDRWLPFLVNSDRAKDAYRIAEGPHKGIVLGRWLSCTMSIKEYEDVYKGAEAAHKDLVLERWLSCIMSVNEYEDVHATVDGPHKAIVLTKWTETVESSDSGYSLLHVTLCAVHGENNVRTKFASKWAERVRAGLNERPPAKLNPSQVRIAYGHLDSKDRKKAIRYLAGDSIYGSYDELRTLCTTYQDALDTVAWIAVTGGAQWKRTYKEFKDAYRQNQMD
ncbi:MAG: hypothetical protein LBV13_00255 [Methanomassiliicoccaceae archaeon]|jgi:tetratricopeptide (TPR) repeat protein|nr:hypothetical protein [Methanomassiliicoccaceae archaeon]